VAVTDQERDDAEQRQRQVVAGLRQRHPDWMVMYGVYTRLFWAYPLFTTVPGNYVSAPDPAELDRLMTATEANFGQRR
jgi:hypothetical protein